MSDDKKQLQLGQRVHLIDVDAPGYIRAVLTDCGGTQYKVAYWINGKREEAWVYSEEIRNG